MTTWQEPRSGATDATELCGESEALVAAIGASLASYACLIGVVTPSDLLVTWLGISNCHIKSYHVQIVHSNFNLL